VSVPRDAHAHFALALGAFIDAKSEAPAALLGEEAAPLLPTAGLLILFGKGGRGKTTLSLDAVLHLASGVPWLGFPVARPLRILLIENEGPREPFRAKLAAKLDHWPHEIPGAVFIHTGDWGGFSLADGEQVERLRAFVIEQRIDLVVGDPLDSLGLDGVGSPDDTRAFVDLMKRAGLFQTVAFWLLHHARKGEGGSDELDEVSGAWGGRPDALLMLETREGNRARLSFPKVRWSRSGALPAFVLAFEPGSESFAVALAEEEEERDYLAEIERLLGDDRHRTAREIAAPRKGELAGIGANLETVKATLNGNPDRFSSRSGREVGRSARAVVWGLTRPSESVETVGDFSGTSGATGSTDSTVRRISRVESVPSESLNRTGPAESVETEGPKGTAR
jgi:hypothetical protein